jgi:hypothetical protein
MKKMITEGGDPKSENHRFKDVPTFGESFYDRFLPFFLVSRTGTPSPIKETLWVRPISSGAGPKWDELCFSSQTNWIS